MSGKVFDPFALPPGDLRDQYTRVLETISGLARNGGGVPRQQEILARLRRFRLVDDPTEPERTIRFLGELVEAGHVHLSKDGYSLTPLGQSMTEATDPRAEREPHA